MVTYKLTAADWTKARIYTGHSARYGKGFLLSSTSFDHAIAQAVWVVTITMYTHYRKGVRKSMVKKGCLVRFVMQNYVFAFPTVVKEDLSSQQGEADISTNRNFLYKCMFPLQKENLCLIFRGFFFFSCSQWPLTQNNPYAKETYLRVAHSGTPGWSWTVHSNDFLFFI